MLLIFGGGALGLSGLLVDYAKLSMFTPQTKAIMVFGSLLCLEPLALQKLLVSPLLFAMLSQTGSILLQDETRPSPRVLMA